MDPESGGYRSFEVGTDGNLLIDIQNSPIILSKWTNRVDLIEKEKRVSIFLHDSFRKKYVFQIYFAFTDSHRHINKIYIFQFREYNFYFLWFDI